MKFRVLEGRHAKDGHIYRRGDVIESDVDLNARNVPGSGVVFKRLSDGERATNERPQAVPIGEVERQQKWDEQKFYTQDDEPPQ